MTPERWKQIKQLAEVTPDQEPAERSHLLGELCKEDAELMAEVESLIASCEQAGDFLEAPALVTASKVLADESARSIVGSLVGPYRIIREIGRGGMGTVYLAVRDDDQYEKQVAIKLVRRGMDTDFIVDRFRHERQILASLDHTNIARLLDGGTTEDGLPYFVMEYIEGSPINQFCDDRRLSTVERVKLFRTVCSAVQYAHQNLVVHRDIKPSNIIVTPEGVAKLLDFGIAKLLALDAVGQAEAATVTMMRPMTPDYASPEQVRRRAITTAADIYSLGVLLYELLTGRRPYRVKTFTPQEIEQVICEQEPEKPSAAIDRGLPQSEKTRRRLKGDLDNIVLRAMRKEPERRYASVEQFSDDLRRHLEGLPVRARKDTLAYRAEKFVRRHKVGVTMAALMLALVVGAIVIVLGESRRAARERDKAERVSAFLVDIFKVSDPDEARGKTVTAREILDKGAERIEVKLKGQPEVQATLMNTVGLVYRSLGLYEDAGVLIEKSLIIRRELHGGEHVELAKSLNDLGWIYIEKQKPAEAEPLLREALDMRRRLLGDHPDVAQSMNFLAFALFDKGDDDTAERLFRESLAMRRRLMGEHMDVAQSLNNLGLTLHDKGDYDGAEPLFEEAIAIDRKLIYGDHPTVATHLNNLALLKLNKNDYAAAEPLFNQALPIQRKQFPQGHYDLSYTLLGLGNLMVARGDAAKGEPLLREALEFRRSKVPASNRQLAEAEGAMGNCLFALGQYEEAERLLTESYGVLKKTPGEQNWRTRQSISRLNNLYKTWGRPDKAAQFKKS